MLLVQEEGYFSRVRVDTCIRGSWWWCRVQRCLVDSSFTQPVGFSGASWQ